jgi:hypothetical protein
LLSDKVNQWQLSANDGVAIEHVNERLDHLADVLYCGYEPTVGPHPEYWQRLEAWVENVGSEEYQKLLFRLAAELYFVGPRELETLYRVAFNANVTHWIIAQLGVQLDDPNLESVVLTALERTWFCPITDSMRINAFYHLNGISGRDYRPDWIALARFGDSVQVDTFISNDVDRIVLLEDFVGTGSQITPAIEFLSSRPHPRPTLLVPLFICPEGVNRANAWCAANPNLTLSPVVQLRAREFLGEHAVSNEPSNYSEFRPLIQATYPTVLDGGDPFETKTYGPFGFGGTGSLVVLATNCPDNTLPLVHYESGTWRPLFPRASRL